MTENEAKEELKTFPANCLDFKENQALHVATKALEEIKQYRAIGTVEQLEWCKDASHWKELFKEKLEQYRAIGTVEEFKALKEKAEPKKPQKSGVTDNKGIFHATNGINGVPYDLCPNCEINLCTDGRFGRDKNTMKYCKNCGQKLDWE